MKMQIGEKVSEISLVPMYGWLNRSDVPALYATKLQEKLPTPLFTVQLPKETTDDLKWMSDSWLKCSFNEIC